MRGRGADMRAPKIDVVLLAGLVLSPMTMVLAAKQRAFDGTITATRQGLHPDLPSCAATCVMDIVPASACPTSITECICSNMTLTWDVQGCVATSCTSRDAQEAIYIWSTTCGIEGRDAGPWVERVSWSLYVFALLFVLARLASRYPFNSAVTWDDMTMIACLVALTATTVLSHYMVESGMGTDFWMVSPDQLTRLIFYLYIQAYIYSFVVAFTKVSILLLYLRLFLISRARYLCYCLLGLTAMFFVSCVFSAGFSCRPVEYNWLGWTEEYEGECFDLTAQFFGLAGCNMSLDILIFMLPIYPLWQLRMSWRRRTGIILMFAVGFFVTVCSVLRLETISLFSTTMNITYDYKELNVWSNVEMNIGVMCACMPGVAAFFKRMFPGQISYLVAKVSPKNSRDVSHDLFRFPNASRTVGGSTLIDGAHRQKSGSWQQCRGSDPVRPGQGDGAERSKSCDGFIERTDDVDISYHRFISTPSASTGTPRSGSITPQEDDLELVETGRARSEECLSPTTATPLRPLPRQPPPVHHWGSGADVIHDQW